MELEYADMTNVFRALCDENRLAILEQLQSGEKCACDLLDCLNLAQSTVSHHLKTLTESGLIQGRKKGKWTYYSICDEGMQRTKELLESIGKDCPKKDDCPRKDNCPTPEDFSFSGK